MNFLRVYVLLVDTNHLLPGVGIADVADYSSSQETSTMRFSKSGMRKKM